MTLHSAHVATYGERAVDTFYVTDLTGDRIEAPVRLKALEKRLRTAAAGESQQHTGSQVRVAGYGPGAANVVGLIDQTDLFFIIRDGMRAYRR